MVNISLVDNIIVENMKKNGWTSDRKANTVQCIDELIKEGYKGFPYAIKLIEELDGISIQSIKGESGKFISGEINFNAFDAGSGEADRLDIFEPIVKETIFPLGMVFDQYFMYVGVSEKIYMGSYGNIYLLGNNIEEALNNTLFCNENNIYIIK